VSLQGNGVKLRKSCKAISLCLVPVIAIGAIYVLPSGKREANLPLMPVGHVAGATSASGTLALQSRDSTVWRSLALLNAIALQGATGSAILIFQWLHHWLISCALPAHQIE
jgi:hypothetical protein